MLNNVGAGDKHRQERIQNECKFRSSTNKEPVSFYKDERSVIMNEAEQNCYDCTHMDIPDGAELCYSHPGSVKPVNKDFVKDFCEGNCPEFALITDDTKTPPATVSSSVKCPACGKDDCAPEVVHLNIDTYGSNRVRFKCTYCKQVVSVYGKRIVLFGTPRKSDKESDW